MRKSICEMIGLISLSDWANPEQKLMTVNAEYSDSGHSGFKARGRFRLCEI